MAQAPDYDDLQLHTLRAYTVLHAARGSEWPGAVVLNIGLRPAGCAISLAANIAGGVCLSVEQEEGLLRVAQRTGACDFIVTSVDEAFRAMKNEIRKRRPLSVGLEGEPGRHLAEIVERGLAPEMFTGAAVYPEAARHFESLGAALVTFDSDPGSAPRTLSAVAMLDDFVARHRYGMHSESFAASAELRAFDSRALALLRGEDEFRRQWILTAPRLFPRDRRRSLWLTPAEHEALSSTGRETV